jgi:hypothetical protein
MILSRKNKRVMSDNYCAIMRLQLPDFGVSFCVLPKPMGTPMFKSGIEFAEFKGGIL